SSGGSVWAPRGWPSAVRGGPRKLVGDARSRRGPLDGLAAGRLGRLRGGQEGGGGGVGGQPCNIYKVGGPAVGGAGECCTSPSRPCSPSPRPGRAGRKASAP